MDIEHIQKPFIFKYCNDACVKDYVKFTIPIFEGYNYKKRTANYIGEETIEGLIIKESYGNLKAQHTFTILKQDETKKLIKGRNLYKNLERALWNDEKDRNLLLNEKHNRGSIAKSNK